MAERWSDQADGLRRLLSGIPLQFVTLLSAQPEHGRPWTVLNLAAALRLAGVGVLVVDAAAGQAGGLTARGKRGHELADVLSGTCTLGNALLPGPEGILVLPAGSGVGGLAEDTAAARRLAERLRALPGGIEVVLVNLPADEQGKPLTEGLLAQELVVTASPDKASVTSTYRLLKRLAQLSGRSEFRLLVTGAASAEEARRLHRTLAQALQRWLGVRLDLLGVMPIDPGLRLAASQGRTLVSAQPGAAAAANFRRMADSLIRWRSHANALARADAPIFPWAETVGLATPSLRG